MIKHVYKLIIPLFALILVGCSSIQSLIELGQSATPVEVSIPENTQETLDTPQMPALNPDSQLIKTVTSPSMREFETHTTLAAGECCPIPGA